MCNRRCLRCPFHSVRTRAGTGDDSGAIGHRGQSVTGAPHLYCTGHVFLLYLRLGRDPLCLHIVIKHDLYLSCIVLYPLAGCHRTVLENRRTRM